MDSEEVSYKRRRIEKSEYEEPLEVSFKVIDKYGDHCILDYGGDKFVEARKFRAEKKNLEHYYENSLKARHPCFLRSFGVTPDDHEGRCFILYEDFEGYLFDMTFVSSLSTVERTQLVMKNLRSLLEGLKHLHEQGLVHGGLSDTRNFIIKDDKFALINIQGMSSCLTMENDLERFMKTMKAYFSLPPIPFLSFKHHDRRLFFSYNGDRSDHFRLLEKLIHHPFLRVHHWERMKVGFEMSLAKEQGTITNWPKLSFDLQTDPFLVNFRGWNKLAKRSKVLGPILKRSRKNAVYKGEKSIDLLRFSGNVYKHALKHGQVSRIGSEFDDLFEGFLSGVYNLLDKKKIEDIK